MWSGSKNKTATWKWIDYQESAARQTKAALYNGPFISSIGSALDQLVAHQKSQGVDLSVFTAMKKNGELLMSDPYRNGSSMKARLQPLSQAYFGGSHGDGVWAVAEKTSEQVIAETR